MICVLRAVEININLSSFDLHPKEHLRNELELVFKKISKKNNGINKNNTNGSNSSTNSSTNKRNTIQLVTPYTQPPPPSSPPPPSTTTTITPHRNPAPHLDSLMTLPHPGRSHWHSVSIQGWVCRCSTRRPVEYYVHFHHKTTLRFNPLLVSSQWHDDTSPSHRLQWWHHPF